MQNIKYFEFKLETKDIIIIIKEKWERLYSSYIWPCAPVLSYFLLYQKHQLRNKTVLEIGCGTGLPGLLAHYLHADVTFTDVASSLESIQESLHLNNLDRLKVKELEWGVFDSNIINLGSFDFIIAADCFYEAKDFEPILATIVYFFHLNKKAEFWTTYEIRSTNRSIEHILIKWGLECESVPLPAFLPPDYTEDQIYMPTIMMLIIKSNT